LRSRNYINTEKESGVRNEGGRLPAINKSCFKQVVSHPQLPGAHPGFSPPYQALLGRSMKMN
jgi:hypothetical protein